MTIVKTHSASETATAMGADVAAGVAVGGPWGIGIGSAAALYVLANATVRSDAPLAQRTESLRHRNLDNVMWGTPGERLRERQGKVLCHNSTDGYDLNSYEYDPHPVATLMLPITAPIAIDQTNPKQTEACWKPLPGIVHNDQTQTPPPLPALWFYGVVTTDLDPSDVNASAVQFPPILTLSRKHNTGKDDTIIDTSKFSGAQPSQFPTSACRSVEVDIVWWQELDQPDGVKPQYAKFKTTVADPRFMQVVNVPDQKSETIIFKAVCGAYVTNTSAPTPATDGISGFIQAAQTVKKAEPAPIKKAGP